MDLAAYINNFYRKYKKLLAMLILVFFVYKVFDYYTTVYEGFIAPGRGGGGGGGGTETASQFEKLRRKADYAQKQAEQTRREAETLRNKMENTPNLSPEEATGQASEIYMRFQQARIKAADARYRGQLADDAEAQAAALRLLI
jgi:hypothetical protein